MRAGCGRVIPYPPLAGGLVSGLFSGGGGGLVGWLEQFRGLFSGDGVLVGWLVAYSLVVVTWCSA